MFVENRLKTQSIQSFSNKQQHTFAGLLILSGRAKIMNVLDNFPDLFIEKFVHFISLKMQLFDLRVLCISNSGKASQFLN